MQKNEIDSYQTLLSGDTDGHYVELKGASSWCRIIPKLRLKRVLVMFELTGFSHFYALQNQLQIRSDQISPAQRVLSGRLGPHPELSLLQAFAPKAEARGLEIERLHLVFTPIDEDKIVAAERIMPELIFNLGSQPVKGSTHIGRLRTEPDTGLITGREH